MASESRKQKDPTRVSLRNVRLSYPNLFTPRAFARGEGKPAFSASALIPKDTKAGKALIKKIEDAIWAAKDKKWPGKADQVKIKKANIAFSDGDDVDPDEDDVKPEQEGMMIVRARNYKRPQVVDENNEDLREQDNVIYGGCYVDMLVTFWGQDYENTKRVNCSLEVVRFREDGEAFGAGPADLSELDDDDDDDDDRGSRRSPSRKSRDDDDDDDRGSRGRSRGRGKDDDEDDDRGSRRRSRDDDEDDGRSSRRRSRDDEEDEDKGSRRSSRRSRDDDEDEDRGSRRRGRREDLS